MSENEKAEAIAENTEEAEGAAEADKPRGRKGPPMMRGQLAKNLGQAARPGFRDPANTRSKASKKGKKKRKK